jgi:hypothetical protein
MYEATPTPVTQAEALRTVLYAATDVNQQWLLLHGNLAGDTPHELDTHEGMAALDFAADPNGSASTYVRMYALDRGLQALWHAKEAGQQLPTAAEERLDRLAGVLPPEYFDDEMHTLMI